MSIAVRILAWLLALSAIVIWWGPGESASQPERAVFGLELAAALWAVATLPRWLLRTRLADG